MIGDGYIAHEKACAKAPCQIHVPTTVPVLSGIAYHFPRHCVCLHDMVLFDSYMIPLLDQQSSLCARVCTCSVSAVLDPVTMTKIQTVFLYMEEFYVCCYDEEEVVLVFEE